MLGEPAEEVHYGDIVCLRSIKYGSILTLGERGPNVPIMIEVMAGQPSRKACMAHKWKITRAENESWRGVVRNNDVIRLEAVDEGVNVRCLTIAEVENSSNLVTAQITSWQKNDLWRLDGSPDFQQTPGGITPSGGVMENLLYNTSCINLKSVAFSALLCVNGEKFELAENFGDGVFFQVVRPDLYDQSEPTEEVKEVKEVKEVQYGDAVIIKNYLSGLTLNLNAQGQGVKAGPPSSSSGHKWKILRAVEGAPGEIKRNDVICLQEIESGAYLTALKVSGKEMVSTDRNPMGKCHHWQVDGGVGLKSMGHYGLTTTGQMTNLLYNTTVLVLRSMETNRVLSANGEDVLFAGVLNDHQYFNVLPPGL